MTSCVLRNSLLLPVALVVCASLSPAQSGGVTRLEQNDPSIAYSGVWYPNDSSLHSGGTSTLTNFKGAQAAISFTGTGITWIGLSDPYSGIAWVYLDGTLNTIDTYSSETHYQQALFSVRGLAPGSHTLSIEVPHIRDGSTDGSWVWIDAFDIENGSGLPGGVTATAGRAEQNNPALNYTGTWYSNTNPQQSGGSAVLAVDAGSRASINFIGTGITWNAYRDEYSGIAKVYLDGVLQPLVDTYQSPAKAQSPAYAITGLPSSTHSLTIEVTGTKSALSGGSWIWIDSFDVSGNGVGTAVYLGGVVNAASYASGAPVAPGSIASVFGGFLLVPTTAADVLPLPTNLSGVSLQFEGGPAAPLFFASRGQLNVQIPWEMQGRTQTSVTALVGIQAGTARVVAISPFAPGIFSVNGQGSGQGTILDTSRRLVDSSNPAAAGSAVVLYCTGLGPVTNQPPTGSAARADPPSETTTVPTVTIGGAGAQVTFSGLAPDYVGLYQVNVVVPSAASKGAAVPLVLSAGGVASNTVTIAVQ